MDFRKDGFVLDWDYEFKQYLFVINSRLSHFHN